MGIEAFTDTVASVDAPDRTSIARLAAAHIPLALPWHPTTPILPGTLFHSSLATSGDPWAAPHHTSPFVKGIPDLLVSPTGSSSYRSVATTSSMASTEHLSVSLGITVGCVFLSASVSGRYDRTVGENTDKNKTSMRATHRSAIVMLADPPQLTAAARLILASKGLMGFEEAFGDYYLAGYVLGGDVGAMVSESAQSRYAREQLEVEVAVKVLWWTVRHKDGWVKESASSGRSVKVVGYDTLDALFVDSTNVDEAARLAESARDLTGRVEQRMKSAGVLGEGILEGNSGMVGRLVASGLVVELVLVPMRCLRDVARWATAADAKGAAKTATT